MSEGIIVDKIQCPLCAEEGFDTACDNAHVFDSGYANCIARHGSIGKIGEATKQKKREPSMSTKKWMKEGEYADIKSRGLSKKTCKYYGYMINRENKEHIANYYDAAGNVVMQQMRTADKKFPIAGNKEYNKTLWGMHLFTPNENVFVTITEGQIDCLSIAEVFACKYPVVSLPNGAKGAKDVILKHKEWLEGFKHVVLAFDNDRDGIAATEECMTLLEPGKVRVVRWSAKDANDLMKEGKKAEIRDAVYNAAQYIPEPILTQERLLTSLDHYQSKTMEWPFKNAKNIQAIRIPAVYTIAARPGIGKTEFVGEIMRSVVGDGGKIGVIALEQTVQQVLIKLTDTLMGTKLGEVSNREFTEEEKQSCKIVSESLVVYDHITFGSSLERVVENIPYMVRTLGCQIIVFDNLSYSATAVKGDERRGIDQAMIALKDSTVKYQYSLFNVCHIKRDNDWTDEDAPPVSVEDIRGSQGVEMFSDYIIGLHRDKQSDNHTIRNTTEVYILKDRFSGNDVGKKFTIKFDPKTRRLE